jgi:hypothetical protein
MSLKIISENVILRSLYFDVLRNYDLQKKKQIFGIFLSDLIFDTRQLYVIFKALLSKVLYHLQMIEVTGGVMGKIF